MSANATTPHAVTLIVPCLNEELNVPRIVARLEAMQPAAMDWEVIIVDDGSTDATAAITQKLTRSHSWLRLVRHPWNLGLGAAVRTGLTHARGSIVCTIDSDCTMAPERMPDLVNVIRDGADMVTATPWHANAAAGQVHPVRAVLSRACSMLYRMVLRSDLSCYTALMRAHRRETIEAVQVDSNGFAAIAEMLVLAIRAGYRVEEIPVKLDRRILGESKIGVMASIRSHVKLLTRIGWKAWQPHPHHAPVHVVD
jgi:dolichol-phosphate mannosyltransferase